MDGYEPASNWHIDIGPPFRIYTNGTGIGSNPGNNFTTFTLALFLGTQEGTSNAHVGGLEPWEGIDVSCVTASRPQTLPGDYDGNGTIDMDDCNAYVLCFNQDPSVITQTCNDAFDQNYDCIIDMNDVPPAECAQAIPAASTWGLIAMGLLLGTAGTIAFRQAPARSVVS